jgi:hypothetical protein
VTKGQPNALEAMHCSWFSDKALGFATAIAITAMPYENWRRMQPQLTEQSSVLGYSLVRGRIKGSCVVLVNVHDVALDVELEDLPDPNCTTTTKLAESVLAAGR